jgi:uncharacterized protein YkwD
MKQMLFFCLIILFVTLACSGTGAAIPVTIPTMDLAQIPTMVVETARAIETANSLSMLVTRVPPTSVTDTPIVVTMTSSVTAVSTATNTASITPTTSFTATLTTATLSPTNTFIPATKTVTKTASATSTSIQPTAANHPSATAVPFTPTSIPPTSIPPTSIPPTVAPPTSIPPTVAPPTSIPPTVAPPTAAICPVTNISYEARVIELINIERANAGLSALSAQGQLGSAAQLHSADMACNNYFSHTGLDGSSSGDRAQRQGYGSSFVGENIAAGYSSPESAVNGWMNSPGHKANILNADYTEIGVGYAFGGNSDYGSYWTAVFARP